MAIVSGMCLGAPGRARCAATVLMVGLASTLAACSSGPAGEGYANGGPGGVIPNRIAGGRYKVGAPYQAAGVWYVPAEQPRYDATGVASWYGDAFHGKATANGELFDMTAVTAAHATLPLPSMVEVTNLDNGRSITVRVNDRGPYVAGRIIDLSRGAAEALGYRNHGVARVRVRYLGPAELPAGAAPPPSLPTPTPAVASAAPARPPEPAIEQRPLTAPTRSEAAAPSLAPSLAPRGLTVQAGAFSDKTKAEQFALRLSVVGKAAVAPVQRGPVTLWRVTVGQAADRVGADALRAKVAEFGVADARVVAAQ